VAAEAAEQDKARSGGPAQGSRRLVEPWRETGAEPQAERKGSRNRPPKQARRSGFARMRAGLAAPTKKADREKFTGENIVTLPAFPLVYG